MKKMSAADTEIQILNEDMIVAVVIAITTCWALQVGYFLETARSSPLKTVLVKAVNVHFNESRKKLEATTSYSCTTIKKTF